MKKLLLSLSLGAFALLTLNQAHADKAEKCKWQENCSCTSPGNTLRWENAYCMAKLGVSDAKEGATKLAKCSRDAMPSGYVNMSPCAKNQFWRTELCALKNQKTGSACMTSDDEIPQFIATGH